MNPKEFKAEKKLKNKHSTKNGGQQVYVLPPNLLQKLGINLGNVGSSHNKHESEHAKSSKSNPLDKKHGNSLSNTLISKENTNFDESKGSNINNEPSIIKTASLMKESVFLSPTFNNTNVNNVVYSSTDPDIEGCNPIIDHATKTCKIIETANDISGDPKQPSVTLVHEIETELEVNKKANETFNHKISDVGLSIDNNNIQITENKHVSSNKCGSSREIKNTINIISEETVTLSKLSELNVLRIPQNTLVPASLNTVISKNVKTTPISHSAPSLTDIGQITENNDNQLSNIKNNLNDDKNEIPVSETKSHVQEFDEKQENPVKEPFTNESKNESISASNKNEIKRVTLKKVSEDGNSVVIEHDFVPIEIKSNGFEIDHKKILSSNQDLRVVFEDPIIENYIVHNENINFITDCNSSKNIQEPSDIMEDFPDNSSCLSLDQIDTYHKRAADNDPVLKAGVNIVIHASDNQSEEDETDEDMHVMEYELCDTTNVNNNNIDHNEPCDEIFKTNLRPCVGGNELKKIEVAEELKSSVLNIAPTEQNCFIHILENIAQGKDEVDSNVRVGGQQILFEGVDQNKTYVMESPHSERKGETSVSNIITDDEDTSRVSLTLNPKRNNLISKLCIQGVEKPGGINIKEEQHSVLLKTYSNTRKDKLNNKKSSVKNINAKSQIEDKFVNKNATNSFGHLFNVRKFCVCDDFGIVSYDRYDDIDEHIHFSKNRTLDCSSDIIFGIYDDNEAINYEEHIKNEVKLTDSSEEDGDQSICWCCADSDQYKFSKPIHKTPKKSVDVASDENVTLSNKTKMSPNAEVGKINNDGYQKTNTKNNTKESTVRGISRKRKASENHNEVSSSKKITNSVSCVICNEELAETVWEDHVARHCLVSLKVGDNNIKGEELYQKLEEQINKVGSLDCLVCGLQNDRVNDFLKHVQECFKSQANDVSTENVESNDQLPDTYVKCGLCNDTMDTYEWSTHLASVHNYLAWKDGEQPLNVHDIDATRDHLQRIVQELGELVCNTCGLTRKYPKSFMHHVQKCAGLPKVDYIEDIPVDTDVECAVCHDKMDNSLWIEHIAKKHNYLAWKVDEKPIDLNNYHELHNHLSKIVKVVGGLKCIHCGFERKYAKSFAFHVNNCPGDISSASTTVCDVEAVASQASVDDVVSIRTDAVNVTCGVCKEEVTSENWLKHIKEKHNYQAWKEGETPVNLKNDEAVRTHLYKILQTFGPLECAKCGKLRKYVKLYLQHVESCTGPKEPEETLDPSYIEWDSILDIPCLDDSITVDDADAMKTVQCGVCDVEMESKLWVEHSQKEHNYMSWQKGRKPLDLPDEEGRRRYLHSIAQKLGALVCAKCGIARKYAKSYMQHVESCTGPPDPNANVTNTSSRVKRSSMYAEASTSAKSSCNEQEPIVVKCDVCKRDIKARQWISHIQKRHNYQAWQEGQAPINLQDVEAVRRHLDEIVNAHGQLVCSKCGAPHKLSQLYLEHVDTCTGPAEPVYSMIKCGVCEKEMKDSAWIKHIAINHEYIAWKETETPVDVKSYEAIWHHLTNLIKTIGALKCAECGLKRKYAKAYLYHVKDCYGKVYAGVDGENSTLNESRISEMDTTMETSCLEDENEDGSKLVKCGVCSEDISVRQWLEHIQKQHNYLAWQDGETPLDLENEEEIRQHLHNIVQKCVRLTCSHCGIVKRKVSMFYEHIKTCDGSVLSEEEDITKSEVKKENWRTGALVRCAVCQTEMRDTVWVDHIAIEHDYLAWRDNENPLNVDDEASVRDHLNKILEFVGELTCSTCGKLSKYVRSYMRHRRSCNESADSEDDSFKMPILKGKSGEAVKCAQCQQEMDGSLWMEHAAKEHNYVAWRETDPPLILADEAAVKDYFYNLLQQIGELVCKKCGLVRKYVKPFLNHIEACQKVSWKTISKFTTKVKKERGDIVKCAVCSVEVDDTEWLAHIAQDHHYLAWRDRDPAIDLENEDEVRSHLSNIVNEEGYLECFKCKLQRKHPKKFLEHIKHCDGTLNENGGLNNSMYGEGGLNESDGDDTDGAVIIKCGVCEQELQKAHWILHIQKEHKYLAWQDGEKPLDVKDKEAVYNHLHAISLKNNGLICVECGLVRKYVKTYLQHINFCSGPEDIITNGMVECGVCGEKMEGNSWRNHSMREHYNVAWIHGRSPIDLRKLNEVEKYMKEYYEYKHKLVCRICGLTRSSIAGFYAHILTCGKTEEEIESFKEVCKICNQKYLCIYKPQHYSAHRAQELAKERKIQADKKIDEIKDEPGFTTGRRKAAEKAISVIEGYAAKLFSDSKCSCGFESENKEELANHKCSGRIENTKENSDDSDVSIKLDDYSEEESDDTDIDSNLSNEDEPSTGTLRKIRNDTSGGKYTPKFSKMPATIRDVRTYLQEGVVDYLNLYNNNERLFPQWDDCNYEVVSEGLRSQYLPTLEQSCKVNIVGKDWTSYKRFQAEKGRGYSVLFTGGCIQYMSWAPLGAAEGAGAGAGAGVNVVCVAAHRAPDCPRLLARDVPRHPALLQMWDFADFKTKPRLAFGLAHDYGTVWAFDWCPAGARDVLKDDKLDNKRPRLGLLAMACSNGSTYIFPVPYPDRSQTDNIPFYKLKPCVELRLTRGRNIYQATSVNWSMVQGYTTISVGYGDGTTAMYDLLTESPLLKDKEGDLMILYPFQDERVHNSCVTALASCAMGAWCSASVTGSAGATGAAGGARPLRAHVPLAATAATFTPLWPSVLLSGDDTIVGHSANEIEWGCSGRRLGGVRALAGSVRRARVTVAAPPLLYALRPHPVHSQGHKSLYRRTVAMVDMVPLTRKRSRQRSNDELSMKVEPITYEEAVQSHGIEFKIEYNLDKSLVNRVQSKPREPCPERFPLADVCAMAYCPAAAHAARLAVATHAGLVFLIDA